MTILIVGGGKMGMSHLALATQYLGKINVALCDTKFSTRILFRLLGYKTYRNVDVAAAKMEILEGVLIATPTPSHARLVKWAISHGIPCFVEKPLTLNVTANRELMSMATVRCVPVQVGFVLRYVATFQRLRQLVSSQCLGPLHDYTASMRGNAMLKSPPAHSWRGRFMQGGGCLNEYGPHIIDLCHFIFGAVDCVSSVRMSKVLCNDADDQVAFAWSHKNGVIGRVEIDWCDVTKRKSSVEIIANFEHADVRVDNSAVEISWRDDTTISEVRRLEIDAPIMPSNVTYYLRGEEFSLELEAFLETCTGRRFGAIGAARAAIHANLEDGCEVDRLIEEIARAGGFK